jgi:ribose transport system substrate-binding protein
MGLVQHQHRIMASGQRHQIGQRGIDPGQTIRPAAIEQAPPPGKAEVIGAALRKIRRRQMQPGQRRAQRIGQAVTNGADAVLISCSDAAKVTGAINSAVDSGVPVMTFDSDAPDSKRFAFYGADDTEAGTQVMSELAKVIGGKGVVAILAGNPNAPNLQKRSQGVIEEAKKYPGVKILGPFNHAETAEDATAEVVKDMNTHPEITAWAMIGGWPLFSTSLMSLDPSKVKIVSIDALPAELGYIDKGIAPVLLAQPVYDWGHKSVELIVDKIVLGKDVPKINKMELVRVSKDSLTQWGEKLKTWGFTVDPKYLAPKK